ncbi:MAG TPA: BrnT family toxin [Woeseiaceae bacterium]|nr:BrnT family toxin [Woeseiaceae bacterium]
MEFEWDQKKAASNELKHAVTFEEATEVFADDYSSVIHDPDHSSVEERFVLFGRTRADRYLAVGFTDRSGRIRIINARLMTRRERKAYEE